MAPYIVSCPENNTRVQFQNFPALNITNNPNVSALAVNATPAASCNETSFTTPGQTVYLEWESPGKQVGPNNSYTTNTTAGEAKVSRRSCSLSCGCGACAVLRVEWHCRRSRSRCASGLTPQCTSFLPHTHSTGLPRTFPYLLVTGVLTYRFLTVRRMDIPAEHYIHPAHERQREQRPHGTAEPHDLPALGVHKW